MQALNPFYCKLMRRLRQIFRIIELLHALDEQLQDKPCSGRINFEKKIQVKKNPYCTESKPCLPPQENRYRWMIILFCLCFTVQLLRSHRFCFCITNIRIFIALLLIWIYFLQLINTLFLHSCMCVTKARLYSTLTGLNNTVTFHTNTRGKPCCIGLLLWKHIQVKKNVSVSAIKWIIQDFCLIIEYHISLLYN